uniref:Diphosphomevalonate decarboxylase n=1 Tax=Anser brachyrhynchus TaxID=132585 RepID=A0A8B9CZC7_9AVES
CHAKLSGTKPCRSTPCHLHLSYRGQARHRPDPAHQLLPQRHAAPGPGGCGAVSPPPAPGGCCPQNPRSGAGPAPLAQPRPAQLRTTTTAAASRDFTEDRLWLNGEEVDAAQPRLQACLREGEYLGRGARRDVLVPPPSPFPPCHLTVRRLARKRRGDEDASPLNLSYKVHVASENNFPTAAGLASSAAGYACLVSALARLYGVEGELSEVARRGSGSACRSMLGGFVQWHRGERPDGRDSVAQQLAPETHWPELRVLILVVSGEKKAVGSTAGMQSSVDTSPLLKYRAEAVVPERLSRMARHIQERDFEGFGQLTMQDSNQFHATCLDTFPPIFYLNDVSRAIIALAHRYNAHHGRTKVAYTFDAGPNAVIFALEDTVDEFVAVVRRSFPPASNGDRFLRGLPVGTAALPEELAAAVVAEPVPGAVRYILHTKSC